MQVVVPELDTTMNLGCTVSEDRADGIVPAELSGGDVPVPDDIVRCLRNEAVALFALAKCILRSLHGGLVAGDFHEGTESPRVVSQGSGYATPVKLLPCFAQVPALVLGLSHSDCVAKLLLRNRGLLIFRRVQNLE